jgi:hypothetical protein
MEGEAMRGVLAMALVLGPFCLPPAPAQESLPEAAPAVTLGRPEPVKPAVGAVPDRPAVDAQVIPASYQTPELPPPVTQVQALDLPAPAAQPPPVPPPVSTGVPVAPAEQYNCGVATGEAAAGEGFWARIRGWCSNIPGCGGGPFEPTTTHHWFESDHCFDNFISPVTNPFLFEDPRSLTEVRPIFIYQATPLGNPVFHGGDIEFFGLQARLAITDRFSIVLNKFGETWMEPHAPDPLFEPHAGFSEIWVGPKFTFWRNEQCGYLGAVGLTFQIPEGDGKVFQNTGDLGLVPYLSFGQHLFKDFTYGSFNALETVGYQFATDSVRSENVFLSLHLDYDVGNLHRFYPLMEFHYFYYTRNGKNVDESFEGRDLFNFGSEHVNGHSEASLAFGGRVKLNECVQFGLAGEFPLTNHHDLMDWRITADVIFRY